MLERLLDDEIAARLPEATEVRRLTAELQALPKDTPTDAFIGLYRQLLDAQQRFRVAFAIAVEERH